MDLFVIAAQATTLQTIWGIIQVAFGLGMVIFIHELGHFLVAKACGVQCDKFFVGFDVGGYKISRKWGETEYGIGIVPLGGYVKMLGQDDNPANAAKEMERARVAKQQLEEREATTSAGDGPPQTSDIAVGNSSDVSTATSEEETAEDYVLDPRSYLAKSVPQRMAIISAGVVMNVIFAFFCATLAYGMGVKYMPCVVSSVIPGTPAYLAGLQLGDEIVEINEVQKPRFRDLKTGVSLGDMENGVPIVVKRPGVEKLLEFRIKPEQATGIPTIGITSPHSLTLIDEVPAAPGSPAAKASPPLEGGDVIVSAAGRPVSDYRQLAAALAADATEPLSIQVERKGKQVDVTIPANPMQRLGLVMTMGPITDVQTGSPAAKAGLRRGDFIDAINGGPVGDPMTLPERLREAAEAGDSVILTVERKQEQGPPEALDIDIELRTPDWFETSAMPGAPLSAPALGICYRVLNRVDSVLPESPAATANNPIFGKDEIVAAEFVLPDNDEAKRLKRMAEKPLKFGEDAHNWPAFMYAVQWAPPGTKFKLTVKRGDAEHSVTLAPVASTEWFVPERGLMLAPLQDIRRADSFGEALALGGRETKEMLLLVYSFLGKLGTQIPFTALGGPGTIAQGAWYAAFDGFPSLLIFLTMLSANLAVVNFLPIPLLDGGHMVFLFLEAIFRRPVSEKIVVAFHTVGFVFIIGLMLFVIALDVGVIPRGF